MRYNWRKKTQIKHRQFVILMGCGALHSIQWKRDIIYEKRTQGSVISFGNNTHKVVKTCDVIWEERTQSGGNVISFGSNTHKVAKPRDIIWAERTQGRGNVIFGSYGDKVAETCVVALEWRHNGLDSVSYHQPHHCLLSRLFGRRSKKISKLRVTGLCVGNSPGTGEIPAQMASYAENVSTWWRHHGMATMR